MIQSAEADVVGPAVAADDPHALAHESVGDREQRLRFRRLDPGELLLQLRDALSLLIDPRLGRLIGLRAAP